MKKNKKNKITKTGLKAFVNKHYVLRKGDEGFTPSKVREPLKVAADIGATAVGTVGGILPNKVGVLLGLGLLVTGRLMNDKTGLLGIMGSSMIGYSVAMAKESSEEEESVEGITLGSIKEGIKGKFKRLKENWLHATYLNKVLGENQPKENTTDTDQPDESIGAIDMSSLDFIEKKVEKSAVNAELKRIEAEDQAPFLSDTIEDFENDLQPIQAEEISGLDEDEYNRFDFATM